MTNIFQMKLLSKSWMYRKKSHIKNVYVFEQKITKMVKTTCDYYKIEFCINNNI